MFIRFVVPVVRSDSRAEARFFYWALDVGTHPDVPDWIRAELLRELRWFGRYLPVPDRLVREFRRRRPVRGICWFRPHAAEHVSRARYVGWLMTGAGAPAEELRVGDPGEVIWRDPCQVVAKPPRDLPRAFAWRGGD